MFIYLINEYIQLILKLTLGAGAQSTPDRPSNGRSTTENPLLFT